MVEENNEINKIILLIKNNDIINAEKNLIKIIKKFPNLQILYDLMGTILIKKKKFKEAIKYYKKALDIDPKYISSILNMGTVLQKIGENEMALEKFLSALKLDKNLYIAKNNIGYILNRQGKYNEAVIELLDAININPNFAEPYLNIGISFQNLNDNEKAIEYYKKALTLKKDFYDVYFNLGEIYKKINKPEEALNYYTKSKNRKTNEKLLECLFLLDLQKDYIELLKNIKKTDKNNRGISAISNYVANQFNIINPYNFCPNPIDFIYKVNLTKNINDFDKFLKKLLDEILKQSFAWEPYARTANKGYVTKGNLSELKLPQISILKNFISEQIRNYKIFFDKKNCEYINDWPQKYNFMMWSNRLKKEGYNKSHIHPSGWLSGVFYLEIPSKIRDNEAGIEFSLHDEKLKVIHKNIPKKIITPKKGDLIMFPSSLYHKTIPFESNEERICIAFDIIKLS